MWEGLGGPELCVPIGYPPSAVTMSPSPQTAVGEISQTIGYIACNSPRTNGLPPAVTPRIGKQRRFLHVPGVHVMIGKV